MDVLRARAAGCPNCPIRPTWDSSPKIDLNYIIISSYRCPTKYPVRDVMRRDAFLFSLFNPQSRFSIWVLLAHHLSLVSHVHSAFCIRYSVFLIKKGRLIRAAPFLIITLASTFEPFGRLAFSSSVCRYKALIQPTQYRRRSKPPSCLR